MRAPSSSHLMNVVPACKTETESANNGGAGGSDGEKGARFIILEFLSTAHICVYCTRACSLINAHA